MAGHHSVAKATRLDKEAHPERFCPRSRCLWKTGGGYCPRHTDTAPVLVACMAPGCVVRFRDGVDGAVHRGGLAVCDGCAEREAICRERHAAKADDAVWARFTLLGFQDDDVERLELRNCPMCSSTVGRFVASAPGALPTVESDTTSDTDPLPLHSGCACRSREHEGCCDKHLTIETDEREGSAGR